MARFLLAPLGRRSNWKQTVQILLVSLTLAIGQANALYPFKYLANLSQLRPLEPEQWTEEFTCQPQLGGGGQVPYHCNKEPTAWRYNYIDEVSATGLFEPLVLEGSLDERMANSMYFTSSTTGLDFASYKFNSGDRQRDLANERLVAGAKVDDGQCRGHLEAMVALLAELANKLNRTTSERLEGGGKLQLDLEEQHYRLARLLDSYGKFESGMLAGHYHAFGTHQQCVTTPLRLNGQLVPSRYCWARMSVRQHLSGSLKARKRFDQEGDNLNMLVAVCVPQTCHSKSFNEAQPNNEQIGSQNRKLLQTLIDSQYKLPETIFFERHLNLDSVFCLVDHDSKWARLPLAGKIFIGVAGAWLLLLLFATYKRRRKHLFEAELAGEDNVSLLIKSRSLLNSLDLFESWLEFIGARDVVRQGRVELDVLNPLKMVGSLTVIMTHAAIVALPLSRDVIATFAFYEKKRFEMLLLSGFVLIDTFFVISGILMTYIILKKLARSERRKQDWRRQQLAIGRANSKSSSVVDLAGVETPSATATANGGADDRAGSLKANQSQALFGWDFFGTWFYVTAYRYLRIVPLFFVVFWFKKTIFNQLGSGPLWDWALNKDTPVGGCLDESWLTPFSFMSAYLPLTRQCLPPTWSLSNDLFFSLAVPPLIILFFRRPRLAKLAIACLILIGFALSMQAYYSIDPRLRYELEEIRLHGVMILFGSASQLYTIPIYRIPAMLVGILAGYALFRYEQRGASPNKLVRCDRHDWPRWFRLATPVAVVFGILSTSLSLMTIELRQALGPNRTAFLVPLVLVGYHVTWSLANATIFLRMLTDWKDSFLLRMCSGRFFRVFSKLTFAMLLVHWDLLTYEANTRVNQVVFTRYMYFASFAMATFWAIPLAVFLYVAVENPIDKLVKTYVLRG